MERVDYVIMWGSYFCTCVSYGKIYTSRMQKEQRSTSEPLSVLDLPLSKEKTYMKPTNGFADHFPV